MNQKIITVVAVSLAVIAAAVAAVVVSVNRSNAAKAYAEAEAAAADAADAEAKTAKAQAVQDQEKRRAAEANREAKADERAAAEANAKAAADEKAAAALNKQAAEENAKAELAKADGLRILRDLAKTTNDTARIEQQKAKDVAAAKQAEADVAMTKLEADKLKAERILAEAKVLELRKTDFETLEQQLLEWKLDLEERERALKPEKTITDLAWAGGVEDSVIDEKGNVVKQVKTKYDPEKDMSIPESSRRLAKAERRVREGVDIHSENVRTSVVDSLVKLYEAALWENRVVDADFYKKSILSMYPDWKYQVKSAPER